MIEFSMREYEQVVPMVCDIVHKLSLPVANIDCYKLVWKKMNNGKLAMFSVLHPRTIFVTEDAKQSPQYIYTISAIIHELRHAYQFNSLGFILYCLIGSRLWAKFTTEPSAYKVQAETEELL